MSNFIYELSSDYIVAICELLNIPESSYNKYWEIIDFEKINDKEFVLVHYIKEKLYSLDLSEHTDEVIENIKKLRGYIICITDNVICCKSFGATSDVYIDEIPTDEIIVVNQYGNNVKINSEICKFQECYDGPLIKMWKYDSLIHLSTNKTILGENSFWSGSEKFGVLFKSLFFLQYSFNYDNPNIFGNFENSNTTHLFLLSHPSLMSSSQRNIGDGKIIYLNAFTNMENRSSDIQDWGAMYEPFISLSEANNLLSVGFKNEHTFQDSMEDVICLYNKEPIRIIPSNSKRRSMLRNNSPNLELRFYELIDSVKKINTFPELIPVCPDTFEKRVENLYINFKTVVPFHVKDQIEGYYTKYFTNKVNLISFLQSNYSKLCSEIKENKLKDDIRFRKGKVLNAGGKALERIIKQTNEYVKIGRNNTIPIETQLLKNFEYLVSNEKGSTLYALCKCINKVQKERSEV